MGADTYSLAAIPPFDRLPGEIQDQVIRMAQPFAADPNTWLVRQGAEPDGHLLMLTRGAAVIVANLGGDEQTVGQCGQGDLAGVTGALTGEVHPVGIRAETAVHGLRIPPEALDLCLATPAFAAYFSRMLATRLRNTYTGLETRPSRLDASPVLKAVQDLIRRAPVTCDPHTPASGVAQLLMEQRVSSAVITRDQEPVGIVTSTDLVQKVLAAGQPTATPAGAIMTAPLVSVHGGATYYEALLTMIRAGIKHLPVLNDNRRLAGVITLGDLARARGEGALAVAFDIDRATDLAHLVQAVARTDDVLRLLTNEAVRPSQALSVMTTLGDRIMRRVIELGMERFGPAPCDWCWLTLGSAGREEQFARTDQDHALIYAADLATTDAYFADLAAFVVEDLEQCGYPRCPGDVMPTNPTYRRSLRDWRLAVLQMAQKPDPDQIRQATIFLDFRPVAGNRNLAAALREQVSVAVESFPFFIYHLVRDDLAHRVPVGPFRTIRTPLWGKHKGLINLKADACVHVVDLLRALALQHRVHATSTRARLHALMRLGVVGKHEGEWLETAYETLMHLRMQDTVRRIAEGLPPSAYLPLDSLRQPAREALRDALVAVARLQETVGGALAPGGRL